MQMALVCRRALCVGGAVLLSGCVTPPPTLYYWGGYQPQTYTYLKGDGKGYPEQIVALEADMQKARSNGKKMPPGYYAHLGMLYGQVGRYDDMKLALETEKTEFPESASFMDFLLKKFAKPVGGA